MKKTIFKIAIETEFHLKTIQKSIGRKKVQNKKRFGQNMQLAAIHFKLIDYENFVKICNGSM